MPMDEAEVGRETSGNSGDTLFEEALGAAEDDLVEATPGPKDAELYAKLEKFVSQKFGAKGSETRPSVAVEEVAKHNSAKDFWCVIDGKVFDLGPFLRNEVKHPGGRSILARQMEQSGFDAAERFVRWHNPAGNAVRRAPDHFVGDLIGELPASMRRRSLCAMLSSCCRRAKEG